MTRNTVNSMLEYSYLAVCVTSFPICSERSVEMTSGMRAREADLVHMLEHGMDDAHALSAMGAHAQSDAEASAAILQHVLLLGRVYLARRVLQ